MTVPHELLVAVLRVEVAVVAAGLAVVLLHVAWRKTRATLLRRRVQTAETAVARTLAGGTDVPAVPRLPVHQLVQVLADATRNVDVSARTQLASIHGHSDLVHRAERWCRSRRWARRVKGARLMMILGVGENVVPSLLDDTRAEVRAAAAAWVAQHPLPAVVGRLLTMLDDDALSCRLAAQATLVRLGPRALEPVVGHLLAPAPRALLPTLQVAARVGDARLLAPALTHRADPDPRVRAAVAGLVARFGGGDAVEALERLLDDAAPPVRVAAAEGLGELGHWPGAPALARRLDDPDSGVRRAAARALSRLGAPGRLYLLRAYRAGEGRAADVAGHVLGLSGPAPRPPGRTTGGRQPAAAAALVP